jgi:hypothetical protein
VNLFPRIAGSQSVFFVVIRPSVQLFFATMASDAGSNERIASAIGIPQVYGNRQQKFENAHL